MNKNTFTTVLESLLNQRPFKPFTISLQSGSRYEIDRPDMLAVRDGAVALILAGGVPVLFDHTSVTTIEGSVSGHRADTEVTPPHVVEGDSSN